MWQFNQSLAYDKRMYAEDIRGSVAYAKALAMKGIYSQEECSKVVDGLNRVLREWEEGIVSTSWINPSVCGV
jgi:argininosuccinate lyase